MHFYQHHIGDYRSSTIHLCNEQDLAYRRLLEMYYDTEKPIPNDMAFLARRIRVDIQHIQIVLHDFFTLTEDGWRKARCDSEIAAFQKMRDGGRVGASKRWHKEAIGGALPPQLTPNANHEPITNNHEPIKKKATVVATPVGVSDSVWQDFVKLRKAKKAQITENVIERIRTEAQKAGWSLEDALRECVFRNWQAFKAEWVAEKLTASQERQNTMAQLTRGLAVPKPAKPFWEKSTDTVEIGNVEPKRLL